MAAFALLTIVVKFWQSLQKSRSFLWLLVGICLVGSALLRVGLSIGGWPGSDSDDATMGIMARHILLRGEHPIFFYGQAYMGTIEAYLGAMMFWIFGSSDQALHFGLVVLFVAFLAMLCFLLYHIHGLVWAVIGVAILSIGSDEVLYHQLEAYGGYLETLFFGTTQIALATWLLRQRDAQPRRRMGVFGLWGLAVGLGIWSDPLVVPFVVVSAMGLGLSCWREVSRGKTGMIVALCFCLGIAPWGVYIVSVGTLNAATSFLPSQHVTHTTSPLPTAPPVWQTMATQLVGATAISIPNNLGATALCPLSQSDWPPDHWTSAATRTCITLRLGLGIGFLFAILGALFLEGRVLWGMWRSEQRDADRDRLAISAGRCMALSAPALTIMLFVLSSAAAKNPWVFSRYLISMAIALPVILATFWEHSGQHRWMAARVSVATITAGIFVMNGIGTILTFGESPVRRSNTHTQEALITYLIQQHETRIYTEFWTCYQEAFLSNEAIACSIVDGDFQVLPNRYPPYDALVRAAPSRTFVFPLNVSQSASFPRYAAANGWQYTSTIIAQTYIVYAVWTSP